MVPENPALVDEIEAMLLEPPHGGDAAIARVEQTLTDGYAQALALEAERWRIERRIAQIARRIADGDAADAAQELSSLSERLSAMDDELSRLRCSLTSLRRHADAVRAA